MSARIVHLPALLTVVAAGSILATPAFAQTMDYGSFEQLLGQPVTLSATGLPTTVSNVPADMVILTADDIRRSGAVDIPGVLAHVIGLDVLRTGATTEDVAVRGYVQPLTPRLLVLVNGRQVYIDIYGATEWAGLPVTLAEIRQIEIVKGPNSALFGFNAAGGVVNIVTWNPEDDEQRSASVTLGNGDHAAGSGVATVRLGDYAALKLAADGMRDDDYASNRQAALSVDALHLAQRAYASADLHAKLAGGEFEFEATHVNLSHLEYPPLGFLAYVRYEIDSLKGEYSRETPIGNLTLRAYTNFSSAKSNFLAAIQPKYDNKLTVVQLQDVFKPAADHALRISAEYRDSSLNTSPLGGAIISYQIASASGTWSWQLQPWLSFTAAARTDQLWLARTGFVPVDSAISNDLWHRAWSVPTENLGLVATLDHDDVLRLTGARGAQLPSLLELGGLQVIFGSFAFGGVPFIEPTITKNAELAWDHTIGASGITTKVALFYQSSRALQTLLGPNEEVFPGFSVGLSQNIGNSREMGLELSAEGRLLDHWRWNIGYSPRNVHDTFDPGIGLQNTGIDYEHTTPSQVAQASLGWSGGPWEADAFAHFQSATSGPIANGFGNYVLRPIPAYAALDGRVAYRFSRMWTLALTGQNLGTPRQVQSAFGAVDRRVEAVLSAQF